MIKLSDKSWVKIDKIPDNLLKYAMDNFELLYSYRPKEYSNVLFHGHKVITKRRHRSYLNTPKYSNFPNKENMNYMFSDNDDDINDNLPKEFIPFLDFINEGENEKYNQVVVNWFEDGNDMIPNHRDCTVNQKINSNIVSISLGSERIFRIKERGKENKKCLDINCENGTIITMGGDMQNEFLHGIPKMKSSGKRISISFRKYDC